MLKGFGNYASSVAVSSLPSQTDGGSADGPGSMAGSGPFQGVVRAKGQLWVASAHSYPVDFHVAGSYVQLVPSGAPYLAAMPESRWNDDDRELHQQLKSQGAWHVEAFGDRKTEAVFIGVKLDRARIVQALNAALLTDLELARGPTGWKNLNDVFFKGEFFEVKAEVDGRVSTPSADEGTSKR